MLQLQTKTFDISRISKLLAKYNIKASITNQVITLYGEVPYELLDKLCSIIVVRSVQNFVSEIPFEVHEETNKKQSEDNFSPKTEDVPVTAEYSAKSLALSRNMEEYNLIYSKVKRGEVYLCDLGLPVGSEQGGKRFVIIIQNDTGNLHSPTTIILPCTTAHKSKLPTHFNFTFSPQNVIDYNASQLGTRENVILAEQIQTIAKIKLRKYLGTLTPEFMKKVQDIIDVSLGLNREVKTVVKEEKVYVDRPVPKYVEVKNNAPAERKDVNMVQIKLLSFVDISYLFEISQMHSSDEEKAKRILELFGFDLKQNGVQYLLEAILVSPKDAYFNLETLSEKVSLKEGIDKTTIRRLIVARVKENFGFKKAPTSDFIRLINNFLIKQELEDEEINI